jgi:hypothetical protein
MIWQNKNYWQNLKILTALEELEDYNIVMSSEAICYPLGLKTMLMYGVLKFHSQGLLLES